MRSAALSRQCGMWLAIAIIVAAATGVFAAQVATSPGHHDSATEPSVEHATAPGPERQQMMREMMAADQRLAELVASMNAATGEKKIDAIAAVVAELVAQREQMQEQMRKHGSMMEQMMSRMATMHRSGGMMKATSEPKKGAAATDHAAHAPEN